MNEVQVLRLALILLVSLLILSFIVVKVIGPRIRRRKVQNESSVNTAENEAPPSSNNLTQQFSPISPISVLDEKAAAALEIESLSDDEAAALPMPIIEKYVEGNFLLHIDKVIRGFFESNVVTVNNIANIVGGGYSQAAGYMDRLERAGVIGAKEYSDERQLMLTREEYEKVLRRKMFEKMLNYPNILDDLTISNIVNQLSTDMYLLHTRCLDDVDKMEGTAFEYWCADLLKKLRYKNVQVTPASGDQGVDIIAMQGDIRYGFQCKRHSGDQGNTPVQEIYAGVRLYRLHVGVVITNQYFTAKAKELASATCIVLWDRDWLKLTLRDLYEDSENKI